MLHNTEQNVFRKESHVKSSHYRELHCKFRRQDDIDMQRNSMKQRSEN